MSRLAELKIGDPVKVGKDYGSKWRKGVITKVGADYIEVDKTDRYKRKGGRILNGGGVYCQAYIYPWTERDEQRWQAINSGESA